MNCHPKILILSQQYEATTSQVIDWLDSMGITFVRINDNDLIHKEFNLSMSSKKVSIEINNKLNTNGIDVVWYRRSLMPNLPQLNKIRNVNIKRQIINNCLSELESVRKGMYKLMENKYWLSFPDRDLVDINKISVLNEAQKIGLSIPETIITNKKTDIISFFKKHKQIIIKTIQSRNSFKFKRENYTLYTEQINNIKFLNSYPSIILSVTKIKQLIYIAE